VLGQLAVLRTSRHPLDAGGGGDEDDPQVRVQAMRRGRGPLPGEPSAIALPAIARPASPPRHGLRELPSPLPPPRLASQPPIRSGSSSEQWSSSRHDIRSFHGQHGGPPCRRRAARDNESPDSWSGVNVDDQGEHCREEYGRRSRSASSARDDGRAGRVSGGQIRPPRNGTAQEGGQRGPTERSPESPLPPAMPNRAGRCSRSCSRVKKWPSPGRVGWRVDAPG